MKNLKKYKEVLTEAVDESAKILVENFDTDFEIGRKKHYTDLVTEVDKALITCG
jgi:fructose-1,6-bisphosphatase/inositol monophosphatase family enzyme